MTPFDKTSDDDSPLGGSHRLAALLCLLGFFLLVVLSQPLLNSLGLLSTDKLGGNPLTKVHPGSMVIILSFLVLLNDGGRMTLRAAQLFCKFPIYMSLVAVYLLLIAYWVIRGPVGVGLLLDTHIVAPMCAIILSCAPRRYCRNGVYLFILLATLNSMVGIAEAIGKFRIFPFDPQWSVMNEQHFRASAFLGHPLSNAMFTSVALFVVTGIRLQPLLKAGLLAVFLASLVAFGGRGALGFTVIGLIPIGLGAARNALSSPKLTIPNIFLLLLAFLVIPVVVLGGLYLLINSDIGARIHAFSDMQDESAQGRWLAFKVFDYMSIEQIIFGMGSDQIVDVAHRMGLYLPMSDIENPWVLMLMSLGALMFPIWLLFTLAFICRLMRGQPLGLQLAVLAYFVTASTSNSFGRKDADYAIMVCAVIAASRSLALPRPGRVRPGPDSGPAQRIPERGC
jgi:hypothetical protein